jgi:protein SCO1/2
MNTLLRGLAAGLLLAATSLTPHLAHAAQPTGQPAHQAALPSDSVYQLALPLTDSAGKTQDWRGLRGKVRVVSMFYTSCQYICPLIIESGKAVDRQLSPAQQQRLGLVLISMDPANDTPAVLNAMMEKRKLSPPHWTLASPTPVDVRAVAGVLGIRYRQLADGGFNHSSMLVLLDADGLILARTEKIGSKPDPDFVAAVRKAADRQK